MLTAFLLKFRKFREDRRGAIAVLIALAIVPLIAMIGVATDSARGYYARSRMSSAVDAAALAGGQVYFEARRVTDARQFFDANYPPGFMGGKLAHWEVDPPAGTTPSASDKVFRVKASAEIPTTFMRLFGHKTMTVSSYAEVTRESRALDVVLAIDMSTSMLRDVDGNTPSSGEDDRITLAKEAAKKLVEVMHGSESSVKYLRMGIVPWAGSVNVTYDGSKYGYTWSDADSDGEFDNSEYTLITADAVAPFGTPDRVTEDTAVGSYFNQQKRVYDGQPVDGNFSYKSPYGQSNHDRLYYAHNSPVPLLSEPVFDPSDDSSPDDADDDNPDRIWEGCVWARWEDGYDDDPSDTEVSADAADGPTLEWPGWSPKGLDAHPIWGDVDMEVWDWEGYWDTDWRERQDCTASREGGSGSGAECTPCPRNGITPLAVGKQRMLDAVERLHIPNLEQGFGTDMPQGLAWGWRVVSPGAPFTESSVYQIGYEPSRAVILLTDGENDAFVGDAYNGELSDSEMDDKLEDIATAMKADNDGNGEPDYEIYVIQFATNSSAELMKDVATEPNEPYYFNAPTGEKLEAAFTAIGNHLSNLRLSK